MSNDKSVMAVIRAARPTFRNDFDKLAFAVHATFLASGHVLTATGPSADTDFTSPSTGNQWLDQTKYFIFHSFRFLRLSFLVLAKRLRFGL